MKKFFTTAIALATALTLGAVVSASNLEQDIARYSAMTDEELAYCDIDEVPTALHERVLEARKPIIYSYSWVADEYSMRIEDALTGEVIEVVPSFSELFPEDWDLPKVDIETILPEGVNIYDLFPHGDIPDVWKEYMERQALDSVPAEEGLQDVDPVATDEDIQMASASDWLRLGKYREYLEKAVVGDDALSFEALYVDPVTIGNDLRCCATSLSASETCNIGFADTATFDSIGHKMYLGENEYAYVEDVANKSVTVRASTFSTPGWANLVIDAADRQEFSIIR